MDGSIEHGTDLAAAWPAIYALSTRVFLFPVASIDPSGSPHVTPVGSVCLHPASPAGFYLERFVRNLPHNLEEDGRFAMLLVDTSPALWGRAILRGRFDRPLGVRLVGRAGPRRASTDEERARFERRVRGLAWTKGHALLWNDLRHARDFVVERAIPVVAGAMTPPETRIVG